MLAVKSLSSELLPINKVIEILDLSTFADFKDQWNRLVEDTSNEPFYRHEFIHNWINSFAFNMELKILMGFDINNKLVAALPLMKERGSILRVPIRQLTSTANAHSSRFDLIAEDGELAGQKFFAHLAEDKSWDVLKIIDVMDNANAWHIYHAAKKANFLVGTWQSQLSPYLLFPASFDKLLEEMSSSFNTNLRRRFRKLEKMGVFSIERVTDSEHLYRFLQQSFAIEQNGWKGQKGTAIAQDNKTYNFYTKLAYTTASHKNLLMYSLNIDGKSIAFMYGIAYRGIYYIMKLGYEESFKDCSPGLILLSEVLKDCISQGLKGCDFLGSNDEWKLKWSKKVHPHNWLFIFRNNSFGNILYNAKINLIPTAKRIFGLGRE